LGLNFFPELSNNVIVGDFTKIKEIINTDITVCSATIEVVDNWVEFLNRLFNNTNKLLVLRTFLGEETKRASKRKNGAAADYPIWQFAFTEFFDVIAKLG